MVGGGGEWVGMRWEYKGDSGDGGRSAQSKPISSSFASNQTQPHAD